MVDLQQPDVFCRASVNRKREDKKRKRAEEDERTKAEAPEGKPSEDTGVAPEAKKAKSGGALHADGDAPEDKKAVADAVDDKAAVAAEAAVHPVPAAEDAQAAEVITCSYCSSSYA